MINIIKVRQVLAECVALHQEIMAPRSAYGTDSQSVNEIRSSILRRVSRPTQTELGRITGLSQSYLSQLINGKRTPKKAKQYLEQIKKELSQQ